MPTILIVDDDPQIVELLRVFLKENGCSVVTAADGSMVIPQIRQHKPALIILDYMMPAGSGADVMRFIRGLTFSEKTPVIVLSAVPVYEIEMNIKKGPLVRFLSKPVDFPKLKVAMDELLGLGEAPKSPGLQAAPMLKPPQDLDEEQAGGDVLDLDADPGDPGGTPGPK